MKQTRSFNWQYVGYFWFTKLLKDMGKKKNQNANGGNLVSV